MSLAAMLGQTKRRRALSDLLAKARQRKAGTVRRTGAQVPAPPLALLPPGYAATAYEQELVRDQPTGLVKLPPNTPAEVVAERAVEVTGDGAVQFGSGGRWLILSGPTSNSLILVDSEESLTHGQRLAPFTRRVKRWIFSGPAQGPLKHTITGTRQVRTARHNFAYLEIPSARRRPAELVATIVDVLSRGRLPDGARRRQGSVNVTRLVRPDPAGPRKKWDEVRALFGTKYEAILTNGVDAYLLGYTRSHSQSGLVRLIHDRGQQVLEITGQEDMQKHGKGTAVFFQSGVWQMYFSGRTERDAFLTGTYPALPSQKQLHLARLKSQPDTAAVPVREQREPESARLERLLTAHFSGRDPDATRAVQEEAQRLVPGVRLQESGEVVSHYLHSKAEAFDAYVEQLYREGRVKEPSRHLARIGRNFQVMSSGTPQTSLMPAHEIIAPWRKHEKRASLAGAVPNELIPTWDGERGVWTTARGAERAMDVVPVQQQRWPEPSKGHVTWWKAPRPTERGQRFELYHNAAGELVRAPADRPLDVDGYRMGSRFDAAPRADQHRAYVKETYGVELPAPKLALSSMLGQARKRAGLRAMLQQARRRREVTAPPTTPQGRFNAVAKVSADALSSAMSTVVSASSPYEAIREAMSSTNWRVAKKATGKSKADAKSAARRALKVVDPAGFLFHQTDPGVYIVAWVPSDAAGSELAAQAQALAALGPFMAPAKRYLKLLGDFAWDKSVRYEFGSTTQTVAVNKPMLSFRADGTPLITDGHILVPGRSPAIEDVLRTGKLHGAHGPIRSYEDLFSGFSRGDSAANQIGEALREIFSGPFSMAIPVRGAESVCDGFDSSLEIPSRLRLVRGSDDQAFAVSTTEDGTRIGFNPMYLAATILAVGGERGDFKLRASAAGKKVRDLSPVYVVGPKGMAILMPVKLG